MTSKKTKPNPPEQKLLTEAELELMAVLWRLGEGTVADVIGGLPPSRPQAYTTISTILRILEQKKFVRPRKEGRGHVYIPTLRKQDYEARTIKHVVTRVFEGAPLALVRQLLISESLSGEELDELRKLVDRLGAKEEGSR